MESLLVFPVVELTADLILVSDRLLEVTGTISATGDNKQVLDKLKVERERGSSFWLPLTRIQELQSRRKPLVCCTNTMARNIS
jgi:hypothetical protein